MSYKDIKAEVYKGHRDRSAIELKKKHIRQFDREFLSLCSAHPKMSVLEIGCGAGQFLRYLKFRGFSDVIGVDYDENLISVLEDIGGCEFVCADALDYVARISGKRTFDRIIMFDILEHLELDAASELLKGLHQIIGKNGKLLLRLPNVSSPWGLRMHFGSFDHVTPYTPGRAEELAFMTGYKCTMLSGQATGKMRKRMMEKALHAVMNRILTYHPEVWEANMLCVFEPLEA